MNWDKFPITEAKRLSNAIARRNGLSGDIADDIFGDACQLFGRLLAKKPEKIGETTWRSCVKYAFKNLASRNKYRAADSLYYGESNQDVNDDGEFCIVGDSQTIADNRKNGEVTPPTIVELLPAELRELATKIATEGSLVKEELGEKAFKEACRKMRKYLPKPAASRVVKKKRIFTLRKGSWTKALAKVRSMAVVITPASIPTTTIVTIVAFDSNNNVLASISTDDDTATQWLAHNRHNASRIVKYDADGQHFL